VSLPTREKALETALYFFLEVAVTPPYKKIKLNKNTWFSLTGGPLFSFART